MGTTIRAGVHLSIADYAATIRHARAIGCTTAQIFTHNPRGWQFKPLDREAVSAFSIGLREADVRPLFSHCNYLINLGTSSGEVREKSLWCLRRELEYAEAFGCDAFVLHVGKHKGEGVEAGVRNVTAGINLLNDEVRKRKVAVLFETVAGQGTEIGADFNVLAQIIDGVDASIRDLIGVCFDTCHAFAAGYDLASEKGREQTIKAMRASFGLERLKLIHVNDTKGELGSHLDRHEHLGMGRIGSRALKAFLTHQQLREVPKVLETPIDERRDDAGNLKVLKGYFS